MSELSTNTHDKSGALEVMADLYQLDERALRESRILNAAQERIPEYFREAVRRGAAKLAVDHTDAEGDAVFAAILDDLETEIRRIA